LKQQVKQLGREIETERTAIQTEEKVLGPTFTPEQVRQELIDKYLWTAEQLKILMETDVKTLQQALTQAEGLWTRAKERFAAIPVSQLKSKEQELAARAPVIEAKKKVDDIKVKLEIHQTSGPKYHADLKKVLEAHGITQESARKRG